MLCGRGPCLINVRVVVANTERDRDGDGDGGVGEMDENKDLQKASFSYHGDHRKVTPKPRNC